jgi:hypothetical protein
MNNKNTHTTAALFFMTAFLGTALFAMTQHDLLAMGISIVLATTFGLVALQSEKSN